MGRPKKLKVLFMGKNKEKVTLALDYLLEECSSFIKVEGVAGPNYGLLKDHAVKEGLKFYTNKDLYNNPIENLDLAVSFLYPQLIKEPYISSPTLGCINFHPAPLPKYRGVANYARAILNGETEFGVSAHYVDNTFDTGDIIEVRMLPIDPRETSYSLEKKSLRLLEDLFEDTFTLMNISAGKELPRVPQDSLSSNIVPIYTKISDIDKLRTVDLNDTAEEINVKIRAFWFPPMGGARLILAGEEFTLINQDLLNVINRWKNIANSYDEEDPDGDGVKLYL